MNSPTALLQRLDAIGRALAQTGDALALIGLGSVGLELDRLDEFSDLDFFVVVADRAAPRFLADHAWLAAAAPIAFAHRNLGAGLHVLFEDGIYAEMAVFDRRELVDAAYTPGRIVWRRDGVPDSIATPAKPPRGPAKPDADYLLREILCNLYIGLSRFHRGERLSSLREIQLYAMDRLLELAPYLEPDTPALRDPFTTVRRFEQRFPQLAGHLADFQQGYARTPQSAAAILDFLAERFPLNEAMVAAIRDLLRED